MKVSLMIYRKFNYYFAKFLNDLKILRNYSQIKAKKNSNKLFIA